MDFVVDQQHKILEQSVDIAMLHKAQGAIEVINKLKALEEYVKK